MSFCTDWLYFLFWMLLLLAELMLFLPPFSKFTDGLQRLLTENRLLPNVDCYGPGSWASLLVTSQALMIETSFRDCVFVFLSRRSLIWVQVCVCVWGGVVTEGIQRFLKDLFTRVSEKRVCPASLFPAYLVHVWVPCGKPMCTVNSSQPAGCWKHNQIRTLVFSVT